GRLRVGTWRENGSAFVAVADTGKGMTEEFMRERLFHPFATTKKKGIGLGLYSCRDIIEQHGGRIDVASRINVGTEFKVILPLKAEELSTGDLESAGGGLAPIWFLSLESKKNLLVVDDLAAVGKKTVL